MKNELDLSDIELKAPDFSSLSNFLKGHPEYTHLKIGYLQHSGFNEHKFSLALEPYIPPHIIEYRLVPVSCDRDQKYTNPIYNRFENFSLENFSGGHEIELNFSLFDNIQERDAPYIHQFCLNHYVKSVVMDFNNMHIDAIKMLANVLPLEIDSFCVCNLKSNDKVSAFFSNSERSFRILTFLRSTISKQHMQYLVDQHADQIEELGFSECKFTEDALIYSIKNLTHVHRLSFYKCNVGFDFAGLLNHLPISVKQLTFTGIYFTDSDFELMDTQLPPQVLHLHLVSSGNHKLHTLKHVSLDSLEIAFDVVDEDTARALASNSNINQLIIKCSFLPRLEKKLQKMCSERNPIKRANAAGSVSTLACLSFFALIESGQKNKLFDPNLVWKGKPDNLEAYQNMSVKKRF